MNANQFVVVEHYSYDIIGTWMYADRNRDGKDVDRLINALTYNNLPYKCRAYLFPDFKFNAKEYATR